MVDFDKISVDCNNDCDSCNQKLECEFLLAETEEEKALAKQKLIERDNENQKAQEPTEEVVEEVAEEPTEEVVEEVAEEPSEEVAEQDDADDELEEENQDEEPEEEEEPEEPTPEQPSDEKPKKEEFMLTSPENLEEIMEKVCCKRGRKLIYRPNEVLFEGTYKVLGTDKKNEEGIKVKNILDAEIKQGVKLGYLDKYDGLKSSEIKEEYENDVLYEFAEQEFKKTGLVLDNGKIKVYVFDWDGKALHHVGFVDESLASDLTPYLEAKDEYSFDVCGIITGGKAKRVIKGDDGKIKIVKEKDGDIGLEVDVSIIKRKD